MSTLAGADARAKLMSAKGPRDVTLLASHPLKLPALSGVGLQSNPAINRGQMNTHPTDLYSALSIAWGAVCWEYGVSWAHALYWASFNEPRQPFNRLNETICNRTVPVGTYLSRIILRRCSAPAERFNKQLGTSPIDLKARLKCPGVALPMRSSTPSRRPSHLLSGFSQ